MELENILNTAKKFLVTSHINPDPDAVMSVMALSILLKQKYKKEVFPLLEDGVPDRCLFLTEKQDIQIHKDNLLTSIEKFNPEVVVFVDVSDISKCTYQDSQAVYDYLKKHNIVSVVIDHHQMNDSSWSDIEIIKNASSTSEIIFDFFIKSNDFSKNISDLILYGILSDTNRFMYHTYDYHQTFKILPKLLDKGSVIQELYSNMFNITTEWTVVLSELFKNFQVIHVKGAKFNYTYISKDFVDRYIGRNSQNKEERYNAVVESFYYFTNNYLASISDSKWGFSLFYDYFKKKIFASFRAVNDFVDTSKIAREFAGGGHPSASGFVVDEEDVNIVLEKVKNVIESSDIMS